MITDAEMKSIIKNAVDHVYALRALKNESPTEYKRKFNSGADTPERGMEPGIPEPPPGAI